jgi:hypothetical protein
MTKKSQPPVLDYGKRKEATEEAMGDPRRGDLFSEMCSNWYTVLEATDTYVIVAEQVQKLEIKKYTRLDFVRFFSYGTIEGYWITLHKRGTDVSRFDDLLAVFKKYELEACHA